MTSLPLNPDVIVIGAGTAGLSAAKALQATGLEAVVLEADHHVGGRCITDTSTFSTPFDHGGSWLHSAEINPLSKLAEKHGLALFKTPLTRQKAVIGDHHLSAKEVEDYANYIDLMWEHIIKVGTRDDKTAIASILPQSRWKDAAQCSISHMLGGNSDVTTPADIANYAYSKGDWLVEGGLGNFIKDLHSKVPVVLDCPVSKVDHSGPKMRITTPKGIVEADHVIVTVSVGVLAAERIEFTPPLPDRKLKAINSLPNGLLNKVGIEFDPRWKETVEGFVLDYNPKGEEYCSMVFRLYDTDFATSFTGGRFARQLEEEGAGAATDFCMQALKQTFGNNVLKYVKKTSETAWSGNPYTFGSYSYASPGCFSARKILSETIDERLHFAGEATMPNEFATVHGAYLSGIEVVERVSILSRNMHGYGA